MATPDPLDTISKAEEAAMEKSAYQGAAEDKAASQKGEAEPDTPEPGGPGKKSFWSKVKKRRKQLIVVGVALGIIGGGTGSFFSFLNVFQLDNLLSSIESKAFVRYQVDMTGRSNKWIAAYLTLRLGEVESDLAPADRDNLLFRANSISADNPVLLWYKLMRGTAKTSKFEDDLLLKHGIKFASIACRGTIVSGACVPGGSVVRFRPALIQIGDDHLSLELTQPEIDAIRAGNVNGLNGRLSQFVDVGIFNSDKEARRELVNILRNETKFYQAGKRFFLRKSIQNQTGIRDWHFFEGRRSPCIATGLSLQTKTECSEFTREIRNKFIQKALPESTKSGKFIQCIFGISSCKNTTDPADPANKSPLAPPDVDCGSQCDTDKLDKNGNPIPNDGTAVDGLESGVSKVGEDVGTSLARKITLEIIKKINVATSVVSVLDTLDSVDKLVAAGTLSTMVYTARSQQAQAVYATLGIMRDQIHGDTGKNLTSEEVGEASKLFSNASSSEGWQKVVATPDTQSASAATLQPWTTLNQYCSPEYQEAMIAPENEEAANHIYHPLCPSEAIGGDSLAKDIENGWNQSFGAVLHPVLQAYRTSGLATITNWFNSAASAIFSSTIGALLQGILSLAGLQDNIQSLVAWLSVKAAEILGAGPSLDENAPPGVRVNHAIMGAAAAAEAAARNQGAAATNDASKARASKDVVTYEQNKEATTSVFDRYLALSNPESALSRSLFAVTNSGIRSAFASTMGSILNGSMFTKRASAAVDPYTAANFAKVETYDFPPVCLDQDVFTMTPRSATNADELGIIPANELTWDLVGNSDAFYARLYKDPNVNVKKVKQVYNCELLDSSIRGSLGALYNGATLDANAYGHN